MKIKIIDFNENITFSEFDCKIPTINNYLKEKALIETKYKSSVTKLAILDEKVIGFYSLSISEFYNEEENILYYGAYLDFLAVDKLSQNQGIGSTLLDIVVAKVIEFSEEIGCRYLILDALKDKAEWYMNRGFDIVSNYKENEITTRMFMDFADFNYIDKIFQI